MDERWEASTPPLAVGDRVKFVEEKRSYTVRAVSADGRFAICTKPFNPRHTVLYTIIDFEQGVRGPDDLVFCAGYETSEDIAANMARLESGDMAVSRRRQLPLRLEAP
jgi:hypothetical protein